MDKIRNARPMFAVREGGIPLAFTLALVALLVLASLPVRAMDGRPITVEANRSYYYADTTVTSTAEAFDFSALTGYDARMGAASVMIENAAAANALMFKLIPVGTAVAADDLTAASNATASETHSLTVGQSPISIDGKWAGIVYERLSADSSIVVRVRL